ncbi:6-bladed beta-propeller [Algoriphagus sp. C2-6-M1]|uniref:6-bladed beta-propeller n=1 Tax=Algoriphagus persicinus TaxID=3108754 RepID=UPI002B37E3EB|nr:6-bladed beta-propeller [Algoriphagus sp. C2-6-M1]MEB2779268.1 6-bladed beta-propeller [Algoriphagus sp. C2-6-M1]
MKYPKLIFLFLCVSLFQNCNQKNDEEVTKSIHTIKINKDFLLSEVNELKFKAIDTIDLEGPGNPPLTAIQDVALGKEFIFLLDRKHGLLKFDYEGNYIQAIGNKGDGPDEYSIPTAIYLNDKENIALISDWEKMVVNSYDVEGSFIASSKKLPGRPISFYMENDKVLVIQEGIESYGEGAQTVLVSSIEPTTLEFKSQETPLYSFTSRFYRIHSFLRPFGQLNNISLFYFPRVRFEGLTDQKDTIYRVDEDHLVPEYQLDFRDFGKTDTLRIESAEINDGYASILLAYKKDSYHLILDLESRTLKFRMKLPSESYSYEVFPKHFNTDVYYAFIRDMDSDEEKNPKIVVYALTKEESMLMKASGE